VLAHVGEAAHELRAVPESHDLARPVEQSRIAHAQDVADHGRPTRVTT
jgi:hypothetical protein